MTDEPNPAGVMAKLALAREALQRDNIDAMYWADDTAKQGDFRLMARLVRNGLTLSDNQQNLIADILEGKVKRRPGKLADLVAVRKGYIDIGKHVLDLQQAGKKTTAAISLAAEKFNCSERKVWNALKYVNEDLVEKDRLLEEEILSRHY
jgi:hypothetical protein